MFGKLEIAISLLDTETNENLYVRFKEEDYIYPVKIPAGNYRLQGFVFLSHYNSIESEKSFNSPEEPSGAAGPLYEITVTAEE